MFEHTYHNKKVFITGHTGFKGSWLTAWLLRLGAIPYGFSLPDTDSPACFEAIALGKRMHDWRGDVRDPRALSVALQKSQPEIVFHLAAQALVRDSYVHPVKTFETNMLGVLNILEAVRSVPSVKAIVIITSDKCYRNNEWVYGYRETDYLGGADPYSASKGCAELIANSYFKSFFQEWPAGATARAGNVIGGGDWAKDRIVPDCARAWASNQPVLLRSPKATRPWQHVLEPLGGYLWLGARLLKNDADAGHGYSVRGQAYNFGPPADAIHTVAEVVAGLARNWPDFKYEVDPAADGSMKECGLLKLCCDKALAELDWKATLDFEETVRYTAEWYARYHAGFSGDEMWQFTQGQITAYCTAAAARNLRWAGQDNS